MIVQIDNPVDQSVKYTSISDRRKHIAAKFKEHKIQQVQYNLNNKALANLAFQFNQLHTTPLCQPTPIIRNQPILNQQ